MANNKFLNKKDMAKNKEKKVEKTSDERLYWRAGNMLYPLPVVMVSAVRGDEKPNIITVAWAGTVCSDPAYVSISVRKERFSYDIIKESKEFINKLLQFAQDKDICIICVLHTNKSQDDHGMRGHLGTILEQKASDVFEIVKNGSIFTVTETECRNKAIDSFSFVLDNDCIPQPSATLITVDQQMRNNEITQTLAKVFEKDTILQYNEIVRRYTNIALCCNKTAKNRIKVALANKYLNQLENGGYELHDER